MNMNVCAFWLIQTKNERPGCKFEALKDGGFAFAIVTNNNCEICRKFKNSIFKIPKIMKTQLVYVHDSY